MFVRTKHHADRLATKLRSIGVLAGGLHGGKTQGARNRVLSEFRDGQTPVLVATDVAARGIHVDGISLVVHVDPPADPKDYLHRAGRTARAGEAGTVVTLATFDQRRTVERLTAKAGVQPHSAKVSPGHPDLVRITGARVPSGEPVVERPSAPARGAGRSSRRDGFPRRDGTRRDGPRNSDRAPREHDPRGGDRTSHRSDHAPRRSEHNPRGGDYAPRRGEGPSAGQANRAQRRDGQFGAAAGTGARREGGYAARGHSPRDGGPRHRSADRRGRPERAR
jgi:superfamily II DNA/RNA helicase